MRTEVIVVGAGPAGLAAAEVTARAGIATQIIERADAVGVPVRTSGGSWIASMRELGIASSLWHPIRRIRVATPREEVVFDYDEPLACVLHVRELYQHLAERAIAAGATLRLRHDVQGPLLRDGAVVGVRCCGDDGEDEQHAQLVIDASGYASCVAKPAGLQAGFDLFGLGAEQEFYGPGFDEREAWLLVGDAVAPGGYGWAFPDGRGRLRLGVGLPRPPSGDHPRAGLQRLPAQFPGLQRALRGASAIESHSGLVPFAAPRHVRLVADGLMVAGDAAGQVSALVGEGIRYALHAGRLAGDTAVRAIRAGDVSARGLAGYESAWHARFERELHIAYAAHRALLQHRDADWDGLIAQLRRVSPQDFACALKGDFSLRWGIEMAWKHRQWLRPLAAMANAG